MILLAPQNTGELPVFYLFWVVLYLAINIIWDIFSGRTPEFHLANLGQKSSVTFNAASFASSLLLVVGLCDKDTMKVAGDTIVPILLAGLSGVMFALQEICPYKPQRLGPPAPAETKPTLPSAL